MKNNKYEIDMCSGPLLSKLISFSVPLIFSGILQLMFNAVDLIVIGRYAGSNALASVGATNALINMFINFFLGLSVGANVCAARFFAAGDKDKMSATVHTAITTAIICGITMSVVGNVFASPALKLMDTPEQIIDGSLLYMRIYFLGTPFFMIYNFGAAILRAIGDTKRPMVFLIIAGIANVFLNLILVLRFNLGVAGVALGTVLSQLISCVLVIIVLVKSPDDYKLVFTKLGINFKILKNLISIGLPAGVQSVVINFSNALLQSSVNSFGEDAVAGYAAANNIFGFLYVSANSITQGCMCFTGQNIGTGNYKRVRKVLLYCLILETVICLLLGSVAYFFDENLLAVYSKSNSVIECGVQVLALTTLTYFLCGYMDCIPGALRGMGYSFVPMILSILGTVGVRIIWILLFFPSNHDIKYLFVCYPLSWIVTIIMQAICFSIIDFKKFRNKSSVISINK